MDALDVIQHPESLTVGARGAVVLGVEGVGDALRVQHAQRGGQVRVDAGAQRGAAPVQRQAELAGANEPDSEAAIKRSIDRMLALKGSTEKTLK